MRSQIRRQYRTRRSSTQPRTFWHRPSVTSTGSGSIRVLLLPPKPASSRTALALEERVPSLKRKRTSRDRSCFNMSGSDYTIKHWQQRANFAERRLEAFQQQQLPSSPKASPRVSEIGLDMPSIPLQLLTAINSTLGLSLQVCARSPCIRFSSVSVILACRHMTCRLQQQPFPTLMISWWSRSGNLKCCIPCMRRWLVRTRVQCTPSPHCNAHQAKPSPLTMSVACR